MKPLTYILWKWQDNDYSVKYTAEHVNVMAAMLRRHTKAPHRIICITDDPTGIECETWPLWGDLSAMKNDSWKEWDAASAEKDRSFPSCYRRLKIFSPAVTEALGIKDGERVVSVDLDMVITDTLDPLFEREDDFVGWLPDKGQRRNAGFNGSIWMFRAGSCGFLWDEFDPIESPQVAKEAGFYGSDQGWLSYNMYERGSKWTSKDGIRHYYPQLCSSFGLVAGTRIAVFSGRKWKPWHDSVIAVSPWVKQLYQ